MINQAANNFKTRSACINKIIREDRYDTEDITKVEKAYLSKHQPKPRSARTDIVKGDIVVVLEGAHIGRRAVLLERLSGHMALLACIKATGGVTVFKIDERYIYKLRDMTMNLPASLDVDSNSVYESTINDTELMETEPTQSERNVERILNAIFEKTAFLKAYMTEDFKIDTSAEFYSLKY